MRQILLRLASVVALVIVPSHALAAQSLSFDRGVSQIGGSASFSSSRASPDADRVTALSLSPRVGVFARRGLLLGASLPVRGTWSGDAHRISYGVGPRASYFFTTGLRTLYPFVSVSMTWEWTRETPAAGLNTPDGGRDGSSPDTYRYRTQTYESSAGAAVMLSADVALSGEAYYADLHSRTRTPWSSVSASHQTSYGVRFGLLVFLR